MPFQKGHKLATGRPRGSQNKELSQAKKILNTLIFNPQHIVDDFRWTTHFELMLFLISLLYLIN